MLLWSIFLLGAVFGVAARLGRFCLLRGLRQRLGQDAEVAKDTAPALQAFALALAVALLTSQAISALGWVDLSQAAIARSRFSMAGVLAGGMIFGVGMVLARACGARSLVLLAGGNLRSLVTVVFLALGTQMAMTGVLTPVRLWIQSLTPITLEHSTLAAYVPSVNGLLLAAIPILLLTTYALLRPALRQSPLQLISAVAIGLLVAVGWWITAHIGVDDFEPAKLTSLSFIGPIAESMLYLQLSVGRELSIGMTLTAGVLAGAFACAIASRTARWEGFDSPARLAASAGGGLLMGFGGALAAGCSIGQGLSGLSTLSLASFPAVFGIGLGAMLALTARRNRA